MLHRNPELYPEPEIFNPERFADDKTKFKPGIFMPFAESSRYCIGKSITPIRIVV